MANDSLIGSPLKKAKERSLVSTVYWHACPHCEEEADATVDSYSGEVVECPCGEKYEVAK